VKKGEWSGQCTVAGAKEERRARAPSSCSCLQQKRMCDGEEERAVNAQLPEQLAKEREMRNGESAQRTCSQSS
jgi:hypothetical protein